MMKKISHPWQQGPSELISYALEHMHKGGDFNQRIAFLLLDVGVETLLKTFLMLPEEVTGVKTSYHKRMESVNGSFYELIKATKEAAPNKLKDIDLSHVQFYHDIRNKLYHQGNGITISTEIVNGYAKISAELLQELLEFDVTDILQKPEIVAKQKAKQDKLEKELDEQSKKINIMILEVKNIVDLAIEKINPELLLPSVTRELEASDPVVAYFFELEKHIPKLRGLSNYYYLARLYPQVAEQPDIDFDENNDAIYTFPPIEKVISDGDILLSNLNELIKIINQWIKMQPNKSF